MYNNNPRIQGLSIELTFTGESKEYDVSYWTRLCDIKSMSRKELSVVIDRIQKIIQEEYLKDRVSDVSETVEVIKEQLKQLPYTPDDINTKPNETGLDNFLE